MTNILLLGGTGAMGMHLAKILSCKEQTSVYVTSRKKSGIETGITYIRGNAKDLLFLQSILQKNWDVIVDFMVYETTEFKGRVDPLLHATKQYVFLSSARVYANSISPLTEESVRLLDVQDDETYLKTDEYALAKARQENILQASKYSNWTIIRPYITYSEARLQLGVLEKEQWLYRALKGRTIVFSSDIATKFTTLTYGYNVAECMAKLIGNPSACRQTFHITTKQALTWQEILGLYIEVLRLKGYTPNVKICDKAVNLQFREAQYQVLYDRVFNRQFDNTKIQLLAGETEFVNPRDGIKRCLAEFLDTPVFLEINWMLEALNDRETGEWTPFREIKCWRQRIIYVIYRVKLFHLTYDQLHRFFCS